MMRWITDRNKTFIKVRMALVLLPVMSLLFQSCVYYNTFYNAQKYFESAQGYAIPETGRPPARAIQDYDRVIERCTYILREHPDSKWADDALYLLGRSLFYQQRNLIQAKERFQDMLGVFPESEYVPSSKIYTAKIEYQLANRSEAFLILHEIIVNEDYQKYHPKILLLRSEWHITEGDNPAAQEDLNTIIQNYPRSDEYEEAFLKLGMSYLESEQFEESRQLFEDLLASRVARRIRYDARYYIALSNYYLGNYDKVIQQLDSLSRDEYQQELFARIYVLRARTYTALGEYDRSEQLFKNVIEDNRRSLIAAEASFYLAEMYFRNLARNDDALEYYNQVSRQSRFSPYVEKAMSRSSVVSQLIQLHSTERSLSTYELVQEQFRLAEYYIYEMNLPDSALSVYQTIDKQHDLLTERLEEVKQFLSQNETLVDSLQAAENKIEEQEEQQAFGYEEDEFTVEYDSTSTDTLFVKLQEKVYEEQTLKEAIDAYQKEFIPYSYFLSAWVLHQELNRIDEARQYLEKLQDRFPNTRYFYATNQLLKGEQVSLMHPTEKEVEKQYQETLEVLNVDTQKALTRLKEIKDDIESLIEDASAYYPNLKKLREKIIYTIGFAYYFDINDSTNARGYFDTILGEAPQSSYSEAVSQFYQHGSFIVIDSLPEPEIEKEIDEGVTDDHREIDEYENDLPDPQEELDPDALTPWEPDHGFTPNYDYPETTPYE